MDLILLITLALVAVAFIYWAVSYWLDTQSRHRGRGAGSGRYENPLGPVTQPQQPARSSFPAPKYGASTDVIAGLEQLASSVRRLEEGQRQILDRLDGFAGSSDPRTKLSGASDGPGGRSQQDDLAARSWGIPSPKRRGESSGDKALSAESPGAKLKRIVDAYCRSEMRLHELISDAEQSNLVWGSWDINGEHFELRGRGNIMAFGARETGEAYVVVSEDCTYHKLGMTLFFNKVDARSDQRVFASMPAKVDLNNLNQGRITLNVAGVLDVLETRA